MLKQYWRKRKPRKVGNYWCEVTAGKVVFRRMLRWDAGWYWVTKEGHLDVIPVLFTITRWSTLLGETY
jgi:hypothetical protein